MTDFNHFHKISDLGEKIIRLIESSSGKATQLCVNQGGKTYLFGDLTEREGKYKLLMYESLMEIDSPNPYKNLAGEYNSFREIEEVIEATEGLALIGDKIVGLEPAVESNFHRASSKCVKVGKIVYPLLEPNEEIKPGKYENVTCHCIQGKCAKRSSFL